MSVIARFLHTNSVLASATSLSASSADSAHPVSWLRNALLAKPWRSKLGWTIVAGFNDKIDFNRGGVKSATIAAGTYVTGADLAAAIVSALEAADATPVWACSYVGGIFTISSDLAFTLLWSSGANKATSCAPDIGFAYTDTASATSHAAASAAYQSRHYVGFDFGSALSPLAFAVRGHNASGGSTFTVGKSAASVLGAATSTVDTAVTTLSGTDPRVSFIASGGAARRYWALVVNDCGSTTGYVELSVIFMGLYAQPSITYESEPRTVEDLSSVALGASGAHFHVERAQRQAWEITFHAAPAADYTLLEALRAAAPGGKSWWFAMDATDNPTTTTRYGYTLPGSWHDEDLGAGYRDVAFTFAEALP